MERQHALWAAACAAIVALIACSSDDNGSTADSGSEAATSGSSSGTSSGSGSGTSGSPGDGGLSGTATASCFSAADCNEGGVTGQLCCFSEATMTASCRTAGSCGSDYTQCASQDCECPAGLHCIGSPVIMGGHYCGMSVGEGGVPTATDAAAVSPEAGPVGCGPSPGGEGGSDAALEGAADAAPEAGPDAAGEAGLDAAGEAAAPGDAAKD